MARYLFTGDGPEIFPSLQASDGSTLVLKPGDEPELPGGIVHARLQPLDTEPATPTPAPEPEPVPAVDEPAPVAEETQE
jgi:hypothetical protein